IGAAGSTRRYPCGDRKAGRNSAHAAVAEPDHHDGGVPALRHVPVALLRRGAGLKTDAAVIELRAAGVHVPDAVVLRAKRRTGPGITPIAHRVPSPSRQGAAAAVGAVGRTVLEPLGEHHRVRRALGPGYLDRRGPA